MLSVKPNSPATDVWLIHNGLRALSRDEVVKAHLVSFLDWIVAINGRRLDTDSDLFIQEVKNSVGRPMDVEVFNAKSGRLRTLQLTPRPWEGTGFLGLFVRFDTYTGTRDNVLHVMEVAPGSPAHLAGLMPVEDFILGADDAVFEDIGEFGAYLQDRPGDSVTLHVFNRARDSVREVTVLLTASRW